MDNKHGELVATEVRSMTDDTSPIDGLTSEKKVSDRYGFRFVEKELRLQLGLAAPA